jgi:hypothetical protein
VPTAKAYAEANGLELVVETAHYYDHPYMQKLKFVEQHLPKAERLIYADTDVLFRPGAGLTERLFERPFNVSFDGNGICTALMAFKNERHTWNLLDVWTRLGEADIGFYRDWHEQSTMVVLYQNFGWVRDMTHLISWELVSHRNSPPGLIAYHNGSGDDGAERMKKFSWDGQPPF